MKSQKLCFLTVFLLSSLSWVAASQARAQGSCTTTREYVTSLEYLRHHKEFAIPEPDAERLAGKVAQGCTGAASRFIRVSALLSGAGLGPRDSMKKALDFTRRTDREADTFIAVFEKAYFTDGLDLDLWSSVKLADSLTTEFEGDTLGVRNDFERLLSFCVSEGKLDLPRPQCGAYAARLAKLGQSWGGGISEPFIHAYEFLRSDSSGPKLPTGKALELSEKLIAGGPDSPENFITAYEYAVSKKGLALADQAALKFATRMGLESSGNEPAPQSK